MKSHRKPFILVLMIILILFSLMFLDQMFYLLTVSDTLINISGIIGILLLVYLDYFFLKYLFNKLKN